LNQAKVLGADFTGSSTDYPFVGFTHRNHVIEDVSQKKDFSHGKIYECSWGNDPCRCLFRPIVLQLQPNCRRLKKPKLAKKMPRFQRALDLSMHV